MRRKKKGGALILAGFLMIFAGAALAGYNLYDNFRAEEASRASVSYLEAQIMPEKQSTSQEIPESLSPVAGPGQYSPFQDPMALPDEPIPMDVPAEIPDYVLNPDMEMPVSRYNGQDYIGILEIPALELKLSVISAWNYPSLRTAPCRYTGSAYTDDMVISAHNYAAHFGGLNKLYEGAAVVFTDVDGNVFNYRVGLIETLNPHDVEYMKDSGWDLSLFTCTPGGSYRVTVRCDRVMGA